MATDHLEHINQPDGAVNGNQSGQHSGDDGQLNGIESGTHLSNGKNSQDEKEPLESPKKYDAISVDRWKQVSRREAWLIYMSLDQTITAVALPQIVAHLGGVDQIAWVTAAYLLTSTALLPIYGKASDIYGRMPVYVFALVIFEIGSALAGAATSMVFLIVARGVQGIGGAGLIELAVTILSDVFPQEQVAKLSGAIAGVFGIASVLGPVLGGVFTDRLSWRWVFWINLPLGAIALPITIQCMRKIKNAQKELAIDWLGSLISVISVTCLVLALTFGGSQYPWNSGKVIGLLVGFSVGIIVFLVQEARHPEPIIPLYLFKIRNFTLAMINMTAYSAAFIGVISFIGLFLQYCKGYSAIHSGLATLPFTAGMMLGAPLSGVVVSKGNPRWIISISCCIFTTGIGLMKLWSVEIPYWQIAMILFTIGVGGGAPIGAAPFVAQASVVPKDIAVAMSGIAFARSMGGAIGVAIFQSIFNGRLNHYYTDILHFPPGSHGGVYGDVRDLPLFVKHAFAYAMSWMFFWGVPFGLAAAISAALFARIKGLNGPPKNENELAKAKSQDPDGATGHLSSTEDGATGHLTSTEDGATGHLISREDGGTGHLVSTEENSQEHRDPREGLPSNGTDAAVRVQDDDEEEKGLVSPRRSD